MAISNKRTTLLRELEQIVGHEVYNSKTQNWGPHGVFQGEGRSIRYPLTFTSHGGEKLKRKQYDDLSPDEQITGRYAFGANELNIMRALDKVLRYLEESHSLKV